MNGGTVIPSLATTPVPSSNRSSPHSNHINSNNADAATTVPVYHHHPQHHPASVTSFTKIQHHNNVINSKYGKSDVDTGTTTSQGTNLAQNPSPTTLNQVQQGSSTSSTVKSETIPSLTSNNGGGVVVPGSESNTNSATGGNNDGRNNATKTASAPAPTTARIVSQNVNGTRKFYFLNEIFTPVSLPEKNNLTLV